MTGAGAASARAGPAAKESAKLYITVAEARRFLALATVTQTEVGSDG